ncbi:hypothetical protein D515_04028 [Grimontia indica]|uniref:Uncharacterized protein n=1 Tax=Grimontia indica TaxID=1056512 RepID=R1GY32_9GAMM|nr:hypothetical protein D515_04028 [Grimontia indica]
MFLIHDVDSFLGSPPKRKEQRKTGHKMRKSGLKVEIEQ